MDIREYLESNILVMDGAMGTYFDQRIKDPTKVAERASITDPKVILDIHKEYIKNGAKLIRTNTFAANHSLFPEEADCRQAVKTAYQLAKKAVNEMEADTWIGASIGPIPVREDDSETDVMREYFKIVDWLLEEGCRIFIFETFTSLKEVKEVASYLKDKMPAFVIAQFMVNSTGYTTDGYSVQRIVEEAGIYDAFDAFGFNCGIGAAHLYQLLKDVEFPQDKFLSALPNSGYPHVVRGRTLYSDSPDYFVQKMKKVIGLGVNICGGCCGTNPKYIHKLSEMTATIKPVRKKTGSLTRDEGEKQIKRDPFMEKLLSGQKVIAVELDPPFHEDVSKLLTGCRRLKGKADIITLADSPMARARADSIHMGIMMKQKTDIMVMPHVCCRDKNKIAMRSQLLGAHINGIRNLLLVTGDPVGRGDRDSTTGVFDFNSIKLMEYVKDMNRELFADSPLYYGGALNYSGVNVSAIIGRMRKKMEAGCSYFLTQPIYSKEDIKRIRLIKEQTGAKILCGIMPLVSYKNALFIKNEMPGIHVPDEILCHYHKDMDRETAEKTAVEVSLSIMEQLFDTADGFYLMTPFNRVGLIEQIIEKMQSSSLGEKHDKE